MLGSEFKPAINSSPQYFRHEVSTDTLCRKNISWIRDGKKHESPILSYFSHPGHTFLSAPCGASAEKLTIICHIPGCSQPNIRTSARILWFARHMMTPMDGRVLTGIHNTPSAKRESGRTNLNQYWYRKA